MQIRPLKIATFLLSLLPVLIPGWRATHAGIGANPVEFVTTRTGDWILRFLPVTLAVTPIRNLHFLTYIWFDKSSTCKKCRKILANGLHRHRFREPAYDSARYHFDRSLD
jgi:hypothetical protein